MNQKTHSCRSAPCARHAQVGRKAASYGPPGRTRLWERVRLILVAGGALPLLAGCAGPAYYAQAIAGHLRLMNARVDAEEIITDDNSDPELKAAVRQAESILAFGRTELGLPESDNYRQVVVTGRDAVTWNVVVAPEFSVDARRWCFPVAGCVPYRGYFKRARAESFAAKRAARGDDVTVWPATAYSTLGWFDDPLLDTMFRQGEAELAAVLFHELAHERLYVRGDTAFNEAYASFVASAGLRRWASATGRDEVAAEWESRQQAAREFNALLLSTRRSLEALYSSPVDEEEMRARKARLFEEMQRAYRRLVSDRWSGVDHFGGWMSGELNNAHLALAEQYQGGDCAFASLFREAGENFPRFHELAEARARLPAESRKRWLEGACQAFASAPDL